MHWQESGLSWVLCHLPVPLSIQYCAIFVFTSRNGLGALSCGYIQVNQRALGIVNICLSLFVHRWYSFTKIINIVCTRFTSPSAQPRSPTSLFTTTLHHMKGSIFVLHHNYGTVTPQDVVHTVRNIGKVQRFVDCDFEKEHDWAIVI